MSIWETVLAEVRGLAEEFADLRRKVDLIAAEQKRQAQPPGPAMTDALTKAAAASRRKPRGGSEG